MTKIIISEFKGIAPKYDREQLRDGYSVTSQNTRSGRQILEPYRAPLDLVGGSLGGVTLAKSLFKVETGWFMWTKPDVKAVRAPLANDPYEQVIITGQQAYPEVTSNTFISSTPGTPTTMRLGVPIPDKLTIVAEDADTWTPPVEDPNPSEDQFDIYYTSWIVVFIDAWGRVGAASEPSNPVRIREYGEEATVYVTLGLPSVPAELHNSDGVRGTVGYYRIYRANYAQNGLGVYQYVSDVQLSETQFIDNIPSGELGEPITTEDWIGPPDDDAALYPNGGMQHVIDVAGSFLAGHTKRMVCMCEPNAFHAWPAKYYKVIPDDVVTISTMGSSILVLTDGYPVVLDGVHPESMSPTRLPEQVPCASPLAVAELFDSVYYANEYALYRVKGYTLENVSKNFMTETEWRALNPSNMQFGSYDGKLIISCDNQTFSFDPANVADGLRTLSIRPQAMVQLAETNDFAFVEDSDSKISVFDADDGNYMSLSWESKAYNFHDPLNFCVGRVRANTFPVDVTFHCEKVNGTVDNFTKTVTDDNFFYLPFAVSAKNWWFTVDAPAGATRPEIRSIELAQSPEEF